MNWSPRKTADISGRNEFIKIHPTAQVAADVELGPFSVIGPNCKIASGNRIHNNVTLAASVELGEKNEIFQGAVLGEAPQDKKYMGESSRVIIGTGNVIRENVTINSGTRLGKGTTIIGNQNLIMGGCHIAHDCILDDQITIANNVLLGGHVKVECGASFGGLAAVHHFVTIGRNSFVGGLTRVAQDVPPFMLVEGNPSRIWSINRVGLKRGGISPEVINALKYAHRQLFRSTKARSLVVEKLLKLFPECCEIKELVDFLRSTESGNHGRARQPSTLEEPPADWQNYMTWELFSESEEDWDQEDNE